MSSISPLLEGTIAAKSLGSPPVGRLNCPSPPPSAGTISGDSPEAAAVAELGTLISSLGSLATQAQSLPLSPPTLPGLPQSGGYRPQATDYSQFGDDSN
jgi:hypothetical protein